MAALGAYLYPNGGTIFEVNNNIALEEEYVAFEDLLLPADNTIFTGNGTYMKIYKTNYKLVSWNSKSDGTGTTYEIGTPCEYSVSYYAIWEKDSASSDTILTTTYGSITSNITSYGTFTLDTKGKFCQNDIVLSFDGESQVNLISFNVYTGYGEAVTKTYQAEENTTWGNWLESSYNIDNFYWDSNEQVIRGNITGTTLILVDYDTGTYPSLNTIIISNKTYILQSGSDPI